MKKAFSLIEIMVAMMILSFVMFGTIKAYSYITNIHKLNEIRYMALRAIDSEMNRLVFHYENYDKNDFLHNVADTLTWNKYFEVPVNLGTIPANPDYYTVADSFRFVRIFKYNKLTEPYGLWIKISGSGTPYRNIVEILDKNNNPNIVDDGDIVGVMAWKVRGKHLSLSLTYPYIKIPYNNGSSIKYLEQIEGIDVETLNLKTSTNMK